jgi:hypothetical protein
MKLTNCTFDPSTMKGPIGMFHFPECGEMQLAGTEHTMIMEQADWERFFKGLKKRPQEPRNDTDAAF